jgi:hypothetical protein
MPERFDGFAERAREWWQTYSIYLMIPVSIAVFLVAIYLMFNEVL